MHTTQITFNIFLIENASPSMFLDVSRSEDAEKNIQEIRSTVSWEDGPIDYLLGPSTFGRTVWTEVNPGGSRGAPKRVKGHRGRS